MLSVVKLPVSLITLDTYSVQPARKIKVHLSAINCLNSVLTIKEWENMPFNERL